MKYCVYMKYICDKYDKQKYDKQSFDKKYKNMIKF